MTYGRRGSSARLFGTGRILFWRGGSAWIGHTEEQAGFHAHHAIQVTLALSGGAVRFQSTGEDWSAYQAAIVAAHHVHAFEARGERVALIFTEPESREGRLLLASADSTKPNQSLFLVWRPLVPQFSMFRTKRLPV